MKVKNILLVMQETNILWVILLVCIVLVIGSIRFPNFPAPAAWLEAWTKWIAAVVAIIVSARVFWSGASALQRLAERFKAESNSHRPPKPSGGGQGNPGSSSAQ